MRPKLRRYRVDMLKKRHVLLINSHEDITVRNHAAFRVKLKTIKIEQNISYQAFWLGVYSFKSVQKAV